MASLNSSVQCRRMEWSRSSCLTGAEVERGVLGTDEMRGPSCTCVVKGRGVVGHGIRTRFHACTLYAGNAHRLCMSVRATVAYNLC